MKPHKFAAVMVAGAISGTAPAAVFNAHADLIAGSSCFCEEPSGTPVESVNPSLSLPELIETICADASNLEDGEDVPSRKAIEELKTIVMEASKLTNAQIVIGDVAPYFGEISVTWRADNRMLRLTAFSDERTPRLDFGTTPEGALGDYQFDPQATAATLVDRLTWLLNPPNTLRG